MSNQDGPTDWAARDITIPLVLSGIFSTFVCVALCVLVYTSRDFINNKMTVNPGRVESSALSIPCPAIPAGWEIVMNDDFDENQHDWPVGPDTDAYAYGNLQVMDGLLHFNVKAYQGVYYEHDPYMSSSLKDFYVVTQARKVSGPFDAETGIAFRVDGDQLLYYSIDDTGELLVWARDSEGNWEDEALLRGYSEHMNVGGQNELAILAQGGHYTFCVNRYFAGEVDTTRYPFGKLGLAVELENAGDEAVFEFDDFIVYAPAQ